MIIIISPTYLLFPQKSEYEYVNMLLTTLGSNKGTRRSSKVISNHLWTKLTFLAFKRWFRIENRTDIKETMAILVISVTVAFLQT